MGECVDGAEERERKEWDMPGLGVRLDISGWACECVRGSLLERQGGVHASKSGKIISIFALLCYFRSGKINII